MYKKLFSFFILNSFFFPLTFAATIHQYAYAPVITFNLANYDDHGNWPERLELLADEIQQNHADIVVLQENRFNPDEPSSKSSYQNMAEQLLHKLNDRGDFRGAEIMTQPIMHYPLDDNNYPESKEKSTDKQSHLWEGLSIISRYKILETGTHFLTRNEKCTDSNARAVQYAKIDIHQQHYFIANAHFGLTDACVDANIKETIDYLHQIAANSRVLLLGDFNTTPDNISLQRLKTAGFTDIWNKFHPNESGYTFPSHHPEKRIDYAWGNSEIIKRIPNSKLVRVIGNNSKNGIHPSDHLGLVVEFISYE